MLATSCNPDSGFKQKHKSDTTFGHWLWCATVFVFAFGSFNCHVFRTLRRKVVIQKSFLHYIGIRFVTSSLIFFMGVLVFAGALHLQRNSTAPLHIFWTILYFLISWFCIHYSLIVVMFARSRDLAKRGQRKHIAELQIHRDGPCVGFSICMLQEVRWLDMARQN